MHRFVRRVLLAVATVVLVGTAGCFDTFRVTVPEDVLEASGLEWDVEHFKQEGGNLGLRVKESRYVHEEDRNDPPFPGVLQVFSFRGGDSQDRQWLMDRARTAVDQGIEEEGILVDPAQDAEGDRRLRSGAKTDWFMHEGTIDRGGGSFFDPQTQITVRVLAEVGVDGRSNAGFITVAFVKVGQQGSSVVPGIPAQPVHDERTWNEIVGDPDGSVGGAILPDEGRGLIHNLRTHG